VVTSEWNRIEPRPGEFAWDALDRKVRDVVDRGLTVMIMIYHGHKVPEWVYEQGVPRVETNARQHKFHPYYLDPAYKPLLSRMIHATAEHVVAYPPEVRERIVGVQCPRPLPAF
jgi:beta-galactosidase GanA